MPWTSISNTVPQYSRNAGGASASGYYLKFYADGTTTPINMATDVTGGTTLAKCQLDSLGYPINGSGGIFIPHIDQAYKLALYENATDADNNTTANAVWVVDDLEPIGSISPTTTEGTTRTLPQWFDRQAQVYDTVAALVAETELNAGDYVIIKNYTDTNQSGPMFGKIVAAATGTADGGRYINLTGSSTQFEQQFTDHVNVKMYGAETNGTDQYAVIESALVYVRSIEGVLYFPCNRGSGTTDYTYATGIQYNASDVTIRGENRNVRLAYTGTGTGLLCKNTDDGVSIERWGLESITLYSATGAIGLDWTMGSYGTINDIEFNYTATNAVEAYASGNSAGTGPYFNCFDNISLIGGATRTQEGFTFERGSSGSLADGPNGNKFTNIKRGASLSRLINLESGTGNLFTNIHGESISDALVVLNDLPSFADSGTSTSTGNVTLTDTSKTWSTVPGDALNFVNAQVTLTGGLPGQTRRIVSNTADTLTLDKPWSEYPGANVTYNIVKDKAVKNMFVNIRQEGLASDNPDGIRIMAGARGNEFRQMEIGSLGTGALFDDQAQDQTNKVVTGDLTIFQYVLENPGPSSSQDLIIRNSVFGGIRSGSNMAVEYTEVFAIGYTAGVATITTDHGGASTGTGTSSTVCKIDSVCTEQVYITGDKIMRSTTNNGIFCHVATDGSFGAATDLIVNVAVRVQ